MTFFEIFGMPEDFFAGDSGFSLLDFIDFLAMEHGFDYETQSLKKFVADKFGEEAVVLLKKMV